jgi:Ras-related protein Rab-6A
MKKAYKIVFLGNSSVGKTTLISQYLYNKVQTPTPTIGIDFLSTRLDINGKAVRLQLWDTAGQERFQSIIGNYTRNTFIAVIVFSIDCRESLAQVKTWIDKFVYTCNNKDAVNILVVANKSDLCIDHREETMQEAQKICDEIGCKLVTTSALDRGQIKELVDAIDFYIKEDLENNLENDDDDENTNAINAVPNKGRCC